LHREGRAADRGVAARASDQRRTIIAAEACRLVHGEGRGAYSGVGGDRRSSFPVARSAPSVPATSLAFWNGRDGRDRRITPRPTAASSHLVTGHGVGQLFFRW
jgi:hypothetical protein